MRRRKLKATIGAVLIGLGVIFTPGYSRAVALSTIWWTEVPALPVVVIYALRTVAGIDVVGMMGTWLAREPISGLLFFFNAMLVLSASGPNVTLRFLPVTEAQGRGWRLSPRQIQNYNRNLPRINLAFDELVRRLAQDPLLFKPGASKQIKSNEASRIYDEIIRETRIPDDVVSTIKIVGTQSYLRAVGAQ